MWKGVPLSTVVCLGLWETGGSGEPNALGGFTLFGIGY